MTLTGLVVASAALVRSGHRLRRLARPSYDRLVEAARHSAVQHVDETGWKIGGRSAWLWVFADEHATLYRIRRSRGHEVVVEVLGEDYQGVLVSDCFLAYDPLNFTKSKCSAHLLKRCSEVEQSKTRGAVRFSRRVAALLRRAMALKRRRGTISDHGYAVLRGKVHAELDRLLAGTYTDPDNARLAKLLRKHRDSVLRFLDHDGVDATNNLAEREGRPAVIARKLSAGNRTEAGAETHAVLASVFRTYRRQGRDILEAVVALLRHGPGHVVRLRPAATAGLMAMTQVEWTTWTRAGIHAGVAARRGKASDGRFRLFAVACCRRIWHLVVDRECRKAVEVAERHAAGSATDKNLERADAAGDCAGGDGATRGVVDPRRLCKIHGGRGGALCGQRGHTWTTSRRTRLDMQPRQGEQPRVWKRGGPGPTDSR